MDGRSAAGQRGSHQVVGWIRVTAGVVALLSAFGAGWYVESLRWDRSLLKAQKAAVQVTQKQQTVVNQQATTYETERTHGEQEHIVRQTQIRTIFKDRPVPGSCAAPDSVVSLLTSAVDSANSRALGQSSSPVPAAPETPDAADRPRTLGLGRDPDLDVRRLRQSSLALDTGLAEAAVIPAIAIPDPQYAHQEP